MWPATANEKGICADCMHITKMFRYLLKNGNPFAECAPSPLGINFRKNKCMVYVVYSTSVTFYNWAVP
jgi:hypothetical protein